MFKDPVDFFKQVTVCFKYPNFYYNLISDLIAGLDFKAADFIGGNILGSILECHVRGLYSYVRKTSIIPEFQADAAKVDIIDDIYQRAVRAMILLLYHFMNMYTSFPGKPLFPFYEITICATV